MHKCNVRIYRSNQYLMLSKVYGQLGDASESTAEKTHQ